MQQLKNVSSWWLYMNKRKRSENGLYLSSALRNRIKSNYQELYEQLRTIIDQLKAEGFKIKYQTYDAIN